MFENLKAKGNKFFNQKNKSPIARFFQNPDYIQDTENRKFQILFLNLMMIIAYSDEEIEESELYPKADRCILSPDSIIKNKVY